MPSPLPRLDVATVAERCVPVTSGVVDPDVAERLARLFKALADPTRVRLVSMIAASPGGEACVCDLTGPVDLSQPTVSHHMKQLVGAGLVTREQRGRWAYYAVVPHTLRVLSNVLDPATPPPGRDAFPDAARGR